MREIVLILHNLRSCHNVGSLLRTADGIGVTKVYFTGYTPYPKLKNDTRLPHLASKIDAQIRKTALGAEKSVKWALSADVNNLLKKLTNNGFETICLEQTSKAISINEYTPPNNIALVLGNEIHGVDNEVLLTAKTHLVIPMYGIKESFNVVNAAAMAMYHLRFSIAK